MKLPLLLFWARLILGWIIWPALLATAFVVSSL